MKQFDMTSASELRNFFECPKRWWFQKFSKYPQIQTDKTALFFGTAVHNAIAKYFEELDAGRHLTTKEGIQEALERHLREVDGPAKRLDKIAVNMANHEISRLRRWGPENMSPVFIEKRFDISPFKGFVDLVYHTKDPKKVIVVDWKSGRYSPDEWMSVQLSIYAYFALKSGYEVVQAYIYFVEHGMQSVGILNIEDALQKAATFFKRVNNPDYHFRKNKTWKCGWCANQLVCYMQDMTPVPGLNVFAPIRPLTLYLNGHDMPQDLPKVVA